MTKQDQSVGEGRFKEDPEWVRIQAMIARSGLSRSEEFEIAKFVLKRWPVSRTQWNSWTESRSLRVTGPILAQAAAQFESIHFPELLTLATEHATPPESLQIVLRSSANLSEAGRHVLERHPEEILTLLLGRSFRMSERLLGPAKEMSFGYRGLLGPPGVLGLIITVAIYVFIYPISLGYFILLSGFFYFISRSLILRDVPPVLFPAELEHVEPEMVHTIAYWLVRECALRGLDPGDWATVSLPEIEEATADTLDGLEENGDHSSVLGLFHLREFAFPELRSRAQKSLVRLSNLQNCEPEDLLERALTHRKFAPPELVTWWFFRSLGTERRWSLGEFEELFLGESMHSYTQRVVWGAFNGYRELKHTFRIDEDGSRVDSDDRPVVFAPHTVIGLMDATALASYPEWAQVFADYEIVEFLHQIESSDGDAEVTRGRLERSGYMPSVGRGETPGLGQKGYGRTQQIMGHAPGANTNLDVYQFRKPISELDMTVYLEVEHGFRGDEEQKIASMVVVSGLHFEMPEVVGRPRPIPEHIEAVERSLLYARKVEEMACPQVEGLLE